MLFTQKCPDVLCDASGLCGDDLALPEAVQEGGLTVIHMTHDRDNWGPWHQARWIGWGPKGSEMTGSGGAAC